MQFLTTKTPCKKIEEQIGESVVSNTDPTSALASKIQNYLATLRKQQKFETRTSLNFITSDLIPPHLYGVIKARKSEKCYPMQAVISTIQYLVELIQPMLNKNKYEITNLSSFVNEAKNWLVKRNEVQVSYDIINLYLIS